MHKDVVGGRAGMTMAHNDLSLNFAFTFLYIYKKSRENNFQSYIPQDDSVLLTFNIQGNNKGKKFAIGDGDKFLADNVVSLVGLGMS